MKNNNWKYLWYGAAAYIVPTVINKFLPQVTEWVMKLNIPDIMGVSVVNVLLGAGSIYLVDQFMD